MEKMDFMLSNKPKTYYLPVTLDFLFRLDYDTLVTNVDSTAAQGKTR